MEHAVDHRLTFSAEPDDPRGVVLMLHGGAEHNLKEVDDRNKQLWRARWMFQQVSGRLVRAGNVVALLRFSVVGWNARHRPEPAPVGDARWALDQLRQRYDDLPVVLLGHSMGARTAAWSADDPSVAGVVGLAPWFPADDPVDQLAGKHVVGAHGRTDRITSAKATRRYLDRAARVAASTTFVDRGRVGHYMLRDIRGWNSVAVEETLGIMDRVTGLTPGG
ncbi:MAG TPA: alpha/beta fold hydrolase [Marmoricola sp.]|jgi:predicted esterase|nr:alpha/beta fold hydrolase [Marmoricola sp.]